MAKVPTVEELTLDQIALLRALSEARVERERTRGQRTADPSYEQACAYARGDD